MKHLQPIQIIGTQRSGSNLLRLMLNQFDEISAPHPPHILKQFMPLLPLYGNLHDLENMERLVDDVCSLIEYNPVSWTGVAFDRKEVLSLCESNSLIEIFRVVYNIKANHDHASYWVCKSMGNMHFFDQMEGAGIKPLYIHLYRDGRDVACSFKNAIVGEKHAYHLANQWCENQEACFNLQDRIGSDRFLMVSYEDLIHFPEREMKRISAFLHINFDSTVFDYYKSKESRNTATVGKMWENVSRPILPNNTMKYKTGLSALELDIFENQAGEVLKKLGYSLDGEESAKRNFSKDQIEVFDKENHKLKDKARKTADPRGMKLRARQEHLITEIKSQVLMD